MGWIDILSKTDLPSPATALINRVSDAIGAVAGPVLKVADAMAEVKAGKIRAVGRIEISDAEQQALSSFSRQWSKERERIANVLGRTALMLEDGDDRTRLMRAGCSFTSTGFGSCLTKKCNTYGLKS